MYSEFVFQIAAISRLIISVTATMSLSLKSYLVRQAVNTFRSWPLKRRASWKISIRLRALSSLLCMWQRKSKLRARARTMGSILSSGSSEVGIILQARQATSLMVYFASVSPKY
jgi:hypothetical protein